MRRNLNLIARLDWLTIFLYLLLVFLGWINIYASAYNEDHSSIMDMSQRYGKQLIWIMAALLLALVVLILDSRFYTNLSFLIYGAMILLLLAVLVLGTRIHGSRSWFSLGSFNLQPSEFAKFATALVLAKFISERGQNLKSFRNILTVLVLIFAPAVLIILQPDMGSAMVYAVFIIVLYREGLSALLLFSFLFAALLFVLTLLFPTHWLMGGVLLAGALVYLAMDRSFSRLLRGLTLPVALFGGAMALNHFTGRDISPDLLLIAVLLISGLVYIPYALRRKLSQLFYVYTYVLVSLLFIFSADYAFNEILEQHQQTRINILLGIEDDPYGTGYNVNQSLIAIGSGGFSGKGFLNGTQTKFNFVPEQSTDFIFCTVGEEWGFLGSLVVVGLFFTLLLRLVFMAERQRSTFSRVYGYSVFSILTFHFMINIGMTIGLVPVVGIPLPFFSYGGSSLWAFTILLFIFLRLDASRSEYLI